MFCLRNQKRRKDDKSNYENNTAEEVVMLCQCKISSEIWACVLVFVELSDLINCTQVSYLFRQEAVRIIWQLHILNLYYDYPKLFDRLPLILYYNQTEPDIKIRYDFNSSNIFLR